MSNNKYPRVEQDCAQVKGLLMCGRETDPIEVVHPRDKPGNIILVHGVNDVGMGYAAAEQGLCAGLEKRLFRRFTPAKYKLPTPSDKDKVEPDPDAVFFKRNMKDPFDSPIIPFYWGYREERMHTRTKNGQKIDRYGNRLDLDLSKGGGPFGNATSNLPDMWNRGIGAPLDPVGDPFRPIFSAPGRMYMVLAAQRLAALIAAIRQYESKDTVSVVAHSQGCLLSLLAQAMLMERGERPADTLILTHPPYALEERPTEFLIRGLSYFKGGKDALMSDVNYEMIDGWQSVNGRLQTLVNIVEGIAKTKAFEPDFHQLNEKNTCGAVECRWHSFADRDNRGKVYLYFCPEDMTVALDNMQGIGWQGVPDYIEGEKGHYTKHVRKLGRGSDYDKVVQYSWGTSTHKRMPMKELGDSFRQRVFTAKKRPDWRTRQLVPVMVGAPTPHDFILRMEGEDDQAHVASSERGHRTSLPVTKETVDPRESVEQRRYGIRTINAEPLRAPCIADMAGNAISPARIPAHSRLAQIPIDERGPCEEVDPITAAIAMTSSRPMEVHTEQLSTPAKKTNQKSRVRSLGFGSATAKEIDVPLTKMEMEALEEMYNNEKSITQRNEKGEIPEEEKYQIKFAKRFPDGRVIARVQESENAARRRWQKEVSPKTFHSVIFDSSENHRRVTAYDVSIGSGKASSDPLFYRYLCALADWRLKKPSPEERIRPGILTWERFLSEFGKFYECEPDWRKLTFEGNVDYYSNGRLPSYLPGLNGALWDIVISETTSGKRINKPASPKGRL